MTRRPHKLRQRLRELDELLATDPAVHTTWRTHSLLHIITANAVIVNIVFNKENAH